MLQTLSCPSLWLSLSLCQALVERGESLLQALASALPSACSVLPQLFPLHSPTSLSFAYQRDFPNYPM